LNTFKPPITGGYFFVAQTSYKLRKSRLFVSYTTGGFFAILGTEREAHDMDTNDINDLLLMHLNDDLFWAPQEQTNDKQQCGNTFNLTPTD
jgi:hypothetical protein